MDVSRNRNVNWLQLAYSATSAAINYLGGCLCGFFVWTNHLAAKHRFMIGGIWFGGAIVVSVLMLAGYQLSDDMQYLVSVFAFFASLLYSIRYFRKSS
jgi:hypothetical protein